MPYCFPRSINQHPRAGETHHLPHSFAHGRFVAVHGALFARTLFFTERAAIQSGMGIVQQRFTFRTETCILLFLSAIDADHPLYRLLFVGNSILFHLLFIILKKQLKISQNLQASIRLVLVPWCISMILYSATFTDFNLTISFSRFFSLETRLVNH